MRAPTLSAFLLVACGSSGEPVTMPVHDAISVVDASVSEGACVVWDAVRQWGTPHDDIAGVAITREADVLIYGYEDGIIGDHVEPTGVPRGFVQRIAGRRAPWRWDLQAPHGGVIDAVLELDDGSLRIAGRVHEPPHPELRSQYQLATVQMSSDGGVLDLHVLGDPRSEHPRQIASSNGWNVTAGYHDLYVPTNYLESVEDPFIVTWRDGDMNNAQMIMVNTSWPDRVDGVAIAPNGHVTVAGSTYGGDPPGAFIRRYDETGQMLATEWISRGPFEAANSIRRLPDGDFLVSGSTWRSLGSSAFGSEDVFVARYDSTFSSRRWLRQLGTSSSEAPLDMTITADGRSWIVGETLGAFEGKTNRGQSDIFVAALEGDGEIRWIWQHGSAGDDRATRIAVDACETVLVAGASNGALVDGVEPAGFDAFVMRLPMAETGRPGQR